MFSLASIDIRAVLPMIKSTGNSWTTKNSTEAVYPASNKGTPLAKPLGDDIVPSQTIMMRSTDYERNSNWVASRDECGRGTSPLSTTACDDVPNNWMGKTLILFGDVLVSIGVSCATIVWGRDIFRRRHNRVVASSESPLSGWINMSPLATGPVLLEYCCFRLSRGYPNRASCYSTFSRRLPIFHHLRRCMNRLIIVHK